MDFNYRSYNVHERLQAELKVCNEKLYHVKLLLEANYQELVMLKKLRLKHCKTSKMRFVENVNSK